MSAPSISLLSPAVTNNNITSENNNNIINISSADTTTPVKTISPRRSSSAAKKNPSRSSTNNNNNSNINNTKKRRRGPLPIPGRTKDEVRNVWFNIETMSNSLLKTIALIWFVVILGGYLAVVLTASRQYDCAAFCSISEAQRCTLFGVEDRASCVDFNSSVYESSVGLQETSESVFRRSRRVIYSEPGVLISNDTAAAFDGAIFDFRNASGFSLAQQPANITYGGEFMTMAISDDFEMPEDAERIAIILQAPLSLDLFSTNLTNNQTYPTLTWMTLNPNYVTAEIAIRYTCMGSVILFMISFIFGHVTRDQVSFHMQDFAIRAFLSDYVISIALQVIVIIFCDPLIYARYSNPANDTLEYWSNNMVFVIAASFIIFLSTYVAITLADIGTTYPCLLRARAIGICCVFVAWYVALDSVAYTKGLTVSAILFGFRVNGLDQSDEDRLVGWIFLGIGCLWVLMMIILYRRNKERTFYNKGRRTYRGKTRMRVLAVRFVGTLITTFAIFYFFIAIPLQVSLSRFTPIVGRTAIGDVIVATVIANLCTWLFSIKSHRSQVSPESPFVNEMKMFYSGKEEEWQILQEETVVMEEEMVTGDADVDADGNNNNNEPFYEPLPTGPSAMPDAVKEVYDKQEERREEEKEKEARENDENAAAASSSASSPAPRNRSPSPNEHDKQEENDGESSLYKPPHVKLASIKRKTFKAAVGTARLKKFCIYRNPESNNMMNTNTDGTSSFALQQPSGTASSVTPQNSNRTSSTNNNDNEGAIKKRIEQALQEHENNNNNSSSSPAFTGNISFGSIDPSVLLTSYQSTDYTSLNNTSMANTNNNTSDSTKKNNHNKEVNSSQEVVVQKWTPKNFDFVREHSSAGFYFTTEAEKIEFDDAHSFIGNARSFFCFETANRMLSLSNEVYFKAPEDILDTYDEVEFGCCQQKILDVVDSLMGADNKADAEADAPPDLNPDGTRMQGKDDKKMKKDESKEEKENNNDDGDDAAAQPDDANEDDFSYDTRTIDSKLDLEPYGYSLLRCMQVNGVQIVIALYAPPDAVGPTMHSRPGCWAPDVAPRTKGKSLDEMMFKAPLQVHSSHRENTSLSKKERLKKFVKEKIFGKALFNNNNKSSTTNENEEAAAGKTDEDTAMQKILSRIKTNYSDEQEAKRKNRVQKPIPRNKSAPPTTSSSSHSSRGEALKKDITKLAIIPSSEDFNDDDDNEEDEENVSNDDDLPSKTTSPNKVMTTSPSHGNLVPINSKNRMIVNTSSSSKKKFMDTTPIVPPPLIKKKSSSNNATATSTNHHKDPNSSDNFNSTMNNSSSNSNTNSPSPPKKSKSFLDVLLRKKEKPDPGNDNHNHNQDMTVIDMTKKNREEADALYNTSNGNSRSNYLGVGGDENDDDFNDGADKNNSYYNASPLSSTYSGTMMTNDFNNSSKNRTNNNSAINNNHSHQDPLSQTARSSNNTTNVARPPGHRRRATGSETDYNIFNAAVARFSEKKHQRFQSSALFSASSPQNVTGVAGGEQFKQHQRHVSAAPTISYTHHRSSPIKNNNNNNNNNNNIDENDTNINMKRSKSTPPSSKKDLVGNNSSDNNDGNKFATSNTFGSFEESQNYNSNNNSPDREFYHRKQQKEQEDQEFKHHEDPKRIAHVVVAFRGTITGRNHATNVDFGRAVFKEMAAQSRGQAMIHQGFNETWDLIQPRVFEALDKYLTALQHRKFPVIWCGHSAGAVYACLAAYAFRREFPSHPCSVYTFGQTRFGNSVFRDLYDAAVPETYRVTLENDVIIHLTHCNRVHVGREVVVDRDGNFIVEPNGLEKFYTPLRGVGSGLGNHRLARYGRAFERIFKNVIPLPFQTFLVVQRMQHQLFQQRLLAKDTAEIAAGHRKRISGESNNSISSIGEKPSASSESMEHHFPSNNSFNTVTSSAPASARTKEKDTTTLTDDQLPSMNSARQVSSRSNTTTSFRNQQNDSSSPNQTLLAGSMSRYQARLGISERNVSPQNSSVVFSGTSSMVLNLASSQNPSSQQQHTPNDPGGPKNESFGGGGHNRNRQSSGSGGSTEMIFRRSNTNPTPPLLKRNDSNQKIISSPDNNSTSRSYDKITNNNSKNNHSNNDPFDLMNEKDQDTRPYLSSSIRPNDVNDDNGDVVGDEDTRLEGRTRRNTRVPEQSPGNDDRDLEEAEPLAETLTDHKRSLSISSSTGSIVPTSTNNNNNVNIFDENDNDDDEDEDEVANDALPPPDHSGATLIQIDDEDENDDVNRNRKKKSKKTNGAADNKKDEGTDDTDTLPRHNESDDNNLDDDELSSTSSLQLMEE